MVLSSKVVDLERTTRTGSNRDGREWTWCRGRRVDPATEDGEDLGDLRQSVVVSRVGRRVERQQ